MSKENERKQVSELIEKVLKFREISKYRLAKDLEITATRLNDYIFMRRSTPKMVRYALEDMLTDMCECGQKKEVAGYCQDCYDKIEKDWQEENETQQSIKRDL